MSLSVVNQNIEGDLIRCRNVRTTLGGGTSIPQGLFIEMFLTSL